MRKFLIVEERWRLVLSLSTLLNVASACPGSMICLRVSKKFWLFLPKEEVGRIFKKSCILPRARSKLMCVTFTTRSEFLRAKNCLIRFTEFERSGNTGIGFAVIAGVRGNRIIIAMPRAVHQSSEPGARFASRLLLSLLARGATGVPPHIPLSSGSTRRMPSSLCSEVFCRLPCRRRRGGGRRHHLLADDGGDEALEPVNVEGLGQVRVHAAFQGALPIL